MSMFSIFILTTAIGVGSVRGPASEQRDAFKALAKATYIQTESDRTVKDLEKRYIPKGLKEYGGYITGTTKALIDKKVSFEWTF